MPKLQSGKMDSKVFEIRLTKNNPKPNPTEYRIETVEQLFSILTEENFDRAMKEITDGLRVSMQFHNAAVSLLPPELQAEAAKCSPLKYIIWIDD